MIEQIQAYEMFKQDPILSCELLEQQGNSNRIYLVTTAINRYLVRQFQITLDRAVEFKIQQKAFKANIGAKPMLLDREKGLMITSFIDGRHKHRLSQQELKKMAQLLKKLHAIRVRLKRNSFKKNFSFRDKKVKHAFIRLDKYPKEYALGHNDLHPQNIIFQHRQIKLIDWEYARYSDIYFDLVSILIEYKLNPNDQRLFLRSYFGKKKINPHKIHAYRLIYKELWQLWFKKLERGEL